MTNEQEQKIIKEYAAGDGLKEISINNNVSEIKTNRIILKYYTRLDFISTNSDKLMTLIDDNGNIIEYTIRKIEQRLNTTMYAISKGNNSNIIYLDRKEVLKEIREKNKKL